MSESIEVIGAIWWSHLIHSSWQAAVVGALAIVLVRLLRVSSTLAHALLLIASVKFVIPPMLAMPWGAFGIFPGTSSDFYEPIRASAFRYPGLIVTLLALHVSGAAFLALRIVIARHRLRNLLRASSPAAAPIQASAIEIARRFGYPNPVRILVSEDAEGPFAAGARSATVVLPRHLAESSSSGDLRRILAHEIAHVSHGDVRLTLLDHALLALWWFHPVAHLLVREMRRVREERCDDAVLAHDISGSYDYSLAILHAASADPSPARVAFGGDGRHPLDSRLRRIADSTVDRPKRLPWTTRMILAGIALVILPGLPMSGDPPIETEGAAAGEHYHDHARHHVSRHTIHF